LESYDVGSLPFEGDFEKFCRGASAKPDGEDYRYFEDKVVEGFLDKLRAGIDLPNYPQFRDMNEMFMCSIRGVERVKSMYVETESLSVSAEDAKIPEVEAIRRRASEIAEEAGSPFRVKLCVTGPHTLSCLFLYRHGDLFLSLGRVLSRIVEENIFKEKHGRVAMLTLDEPTFGAFDDHLIDYGAEGRENLRKAWEDVFHRAKSAGVVTVIHLHSTSNRLFWEVEFLDVVESHVDDFLYRSRQTKRLLEDTDKFLKASVCRTSFDTLIKTALESSPKPTRTTSIEEEIGRVWRRIKKGEVDPTIYIESPEVMKKRLSKVVETFGPERVPYAGPECGLRGFPTYRSAVECLRRVAGVVSSFRQNQPR